MTDKETVLKMGRELNRECVFVKQGEKIKRGSFEGICASCNDWRVVELRFSKGEMAELPTNIGNLTELRRLDISYAPITKLPETIFCLSKLRWLDIAHTKLTELPQSIENLSALRCLVIYGTEIAELPETIGKLKNLEELYLVAMWKLKTLPKSFGNLTSLVELDARHAQFNKLPESFGNLTSLKILDLDQSEVNELPQSFGNLSSLENLDIRSNRIVTMPDSIVNLKALKYLIAHHVKIDKSKVDEIRESIPDLKMDIIGRTIPMDKDVDDNAYRGDFLTINIQGGSAV